MHAVFFSNIMNHCILVDVSEWKPECISYLIIYAHIERWALANKHHEIKKTKHSVKEDTQCDNILCPDLRVPFSLLLMNIVPSYYTFKVMGPTPKQEDSCHAITHFLKPTRMSQKITLNIYILYILKTHSAPWIKTLLRQVSNDQKHNATDNIKKPKEYNVIFCTTVTDEYRIILIYVLF